MATFVQRGRTWQVKIRRRGYPTQTASFDTKGEAQGWARKLESEMDRGLFADYSTARRTLYADVLRRYLHSVTDRKEDDESERYRIHALLRDPVAQYSMSALTAPVLADYRDRRLNLVASETVRRELSLISSTINAAMRDYSINLPINPTRQIRWPERSPSRKRRIARIEEREILDALKPVRRRKNGQFRPGPRNPWMRSFFALALETGARRCDLLRLRWSLVDLGRRVARVPKSKNGDSRDIPLSRKAVRLLRWMRREDDRVFPTTASAVASAWDRAKDRVASQARFHDARHEATTRLARKGLTVMELAAVTGHKDLKMLNRYVHLDPEEVAKKLD